MKKIMSVEMRNLKQLIVLIVFTMLVFGCQKDDRDELIDSDSPFGIEEARNSNGDFYGTERLSVVIQESSRTAGSADDIRDAILQDVKEFMGDEPQADDMTCVVVMVK